MKGLLMAALAVCFVASAANAAVIYDENVDGDAGEGAVDRPHLAIVDGVNEIRGTVADLETATGIDPRTDGDQFGLTIPVGRQLRNLSLDAEATTLGNLSFLNISATIISITPPMRQEFTAPLNFVGPGVSTTGPLSTTGLVQPPGTGGLLLEPVPAGDRFLEPGGVLGPTTAPFGFVADYTLRFEIFDPAATPNAVVPVPATLPLLALRLAALGVAVPLSRRG